MTSISSSTGPRFKRAPWLALCGLTGLLMSAAYAAPHTPRSSEPPAPDADKTQKKTAPVAASLPSEKAAMQGDDDTPDASDPMTAPKTAVLEVKKFRDAGGMMSLSGRDARQNEKFAEALATYLKTSGGSRFVTVSDSGRKTNAQFTLEGELSRVEPVKSQPGMGGQYLCTLRLFSESKPRRLVHQWAGRADNFRYLYGNLGSVDGVNKQGLVGEFGERVTGLFGSGTGRADGWSAFVDKAARRRRVLASVVPDSGDGAGQGTTPTIAAARLTAGQNFHLRVASQDMGDVYLVSMKGDRPQPLFVPTDDQTVTVGPKDPTTLPLDRPLQAPDVDAPTVRQYVVLVRRYADGAAPPKRGVPDGKPIAPPPGAKPTGVPPTVTLKLEQDGPLGAVILHGDTDPIPVQVMEMGGTRPEPMPSNPTIARLLKMAQSDPDGTWSAYRLSVTIHPTE